MKARSIDGGPVALAGIAFLLSGACALVYQVAWQRILALHSGVGVYSVAMIVAAFMAGLGLGSWLGGRASARVGAAAALAAFALIEIGIGAMGAVSCRVYYDWLYPYASGLPSPSWSGGLLHLAALLPPTTLMGMSLPFMARAWVRSASAAGRTVGYLYGVNVLGAALGAFAAPWLLIPRLGIEGAVLAAAAGNVAAGIGALGLWGRVRRPLAATAEEEPDADPPRRHGFSLWLALYGLSGFVALSLEIVWFRLLDVAVKSTAFTFGTVLALYLLGSALGCLLAVPLASRIARPLLVFLLCQCAIVVAAAVPVILLVHLPPGTPWLDWYFTYWGQFRFFRFGASLDPVYVTRLYVVLPLVLFLLPTALMGFAFPVLQRAVHDEVRTSGRKVGALQAANIAGCMAGSLFVGVVALDSLGTAGTLRLLVALGLAFAAVGVAQHGRLFGVAAAAIVLAAAALPDAEALWRRLHGLDRAATDALFEEDATGVVAVNRQPSGQWRLAVNGKGNSWLPFGGAHTVLGALPALVHPAPRDVAVIGLASGDTVWAAACRRETTSVTVFEISSPQPQILARLVEREPLPDLARLLADRRVRVLLEDGRKALAARDARYDLIEADAIWPQSAYSGNLYSREFFALCARRLRPGGVMCTWAPTPRVYATFREVFPHVLETDGGAVLIGSPDPLPLEVETWLARLREAAPYLGEGRLGGIAQRLRACRPALENRGLRPNRDLFPRDEFASP